MNSKEYDYIIIGAGFSGLSCALRLAMFDHKVAILESHSIPGGLNSYYKRKAGKEIIRIDTGLHALTNYSVKGELGTKLFPQILKQFRFSYDQFNLCPQIKSKIILQDQMIEFSNDINFLSQNVKNLFPNHHQEFLNFLEFVKTQNLNLYNAPFASGLEMISSFINNKNLINLLSFPIICYGSCWPKDIDSYLYLSLFKAIYLEGLSRPREGIKTILDLFEEKLKTYKNVDLIYKNQVANLEIQKNAIRVETQKSTFLTKKVFSSIGYPKMKDLLGEKLHKENLSQVSFVEVVFVYDEEKDQAYEETIIFFNESETNIFEQKDVLIGKSAGVICCVENFKSSKKLNKIIKVTFYGNYSAWSKLDKKEYIKNKKTIIDYAKSKLQLYLPKEKRNPVYIDCFTPKTIKRYTSHLNGMVYGSTDKFKDGLFHASKDLILIGADQGNVGITGCILSGASMANKHGLSLR